MAISYEQLRSAKLKSNNAAMTLEGRRTPPVKVFALLGAALLALIVYMITKWIVLGHVKPAPVGDTSMVTEWTYFLIRANEALMVAISSFVVWRYIVQPWRRAGKLSLEGLFVIAWGCLWAMDPWSNAGREWWNYSSLFLNLGCFQCEVPGWQTPLGYNYSEPILFIGVMYWGWLPAWCIAQCWMMRKAKERWPKIGWLGLLGVAFAAGIAMDVFAEVLWVHQGLYTYDGAIRSVSIWAGHYYQFPIYEALMMASFWSGGALLLYYKDDKGLTVAERGVDEVRASGTRRTFVRFLAILGYMAAVFVTTYELPAYLLALHRDARPADAYVGHLTNMMCGPGTEYACGGPEVPAVVSKESAYLTPSGELKWPEGTKMSPQKMWLDKPRAAP